MSQFFKTKEETKQWLDDMSIKSYKINDDLTVDVKGDVDISNRGLNNIPVKFGKVNGYFNCGINELTTLEGVPTSVDRDFFCSFNKLTNLQGAPISVGGDFYCVDSKLTTLEGFPNYVGGDFNCNKNNLKTLEFAPKNVVGYFSCSNNQLTTLKWAPKKVGGRFYCNNNQLESIKDLPDCEYANIEFNSKYSHLSTKEEIFKQRDLEKAEYEQSILNTSINEVSQKTKPKIRFKI